MKKTFVVLSIFIICISAFTFAGCDWLNEENREPIVLEYKGMTINIPYSNNYTAEVKGDIIYLRGTIDFSINEFLGYILPPDGKEFYGTGEQSLNTEIATFIVVRNYSFKTYYSRQEAKNNEGTVEQVNIKFLRYKNTKGSYAAYYVNTAEKRFLCYSTSFDQIMGVKEENEYNSFSFVSGTNTIIGQYTSPETTVKIIVVVN